MTATERRKLAQAARELAGEYAEGRGPALSNCGYCNCAAGQVALRAGYKEWRARADVAHDIAELIQLQLDPFSEPPTIFCNLISEATEKEIRGLPGAVVFPLMALADELEAQDG